MSTFEFNQQLMPQSLVDIDNIGQFALEATNDEGYFWYLILVTSLGNVTVASCGPVIPDVNLLPSGYTCSMYQMEYKEARIEKTINNWLNDRGKALTEAHLVNIEDALCEFRDLGTYLRTEVVKDYEETRD